MKHLLAAVLVMVGMSSAHAGSGSPPPGLKQGDAITIYKTTPGITNYWDGHGNNVQTYTDSNGLTTYTGKNGTGTMYEPNADRSPEVPSYRSLRDARPSLDRCQGVSAYLDSCR
jgi:hypothetical protein